MRFSGIGTLAARPHIKDITTNKPVRNRDKQYRVVEVKIMTPSSDEDKPHLIHVDSTNERVIDTLSGSSIGDQFEFDGTVVAYYDKKGRPYVGLRAWKAVKTFSLKSYRNRVKKEISEEVGHGDWYAENQALRRALTESERANRVLASKIRSTVASKKYQGSAKGNRIGT